MIRLVVAALFLAAASPAAAFDITGTWTGTRKCTLFDVGVKGKTVREGTVDITQAGSLVGFASTVGSAQLYSGIVNADAAKPEKGEIFLSHCGTNDVVGDAGAFDGLGRFTVKTKPGKTKATITGTTIFADTSVADPIFGTCKWKLTRTAVAQPGVSTSCGITVSSRDVKKNVAYLSPTDLKRVHDDLMAFPLASYQYTSPEIPESSTATHLGFIIEDVAPSPSIAETGKRVDLYGYTSMAVAALQTQSHEIAALKESVAKLEARLAAACDDPSGRVRARGKSAPQLAR